MTGGAPHRPPGIWHAPGWAMNVPAGGPRLALRAAWALLRHPMALRRWMAVAWEMQSRGLLQDLSAEFMRAVRPGVHRGRSVQDRTVQLIDHVDWLDGALQPTALRMLAAGQPVTLADLPAPRGYQVMQLQLQRAPSHSPEGELLLTLVLQRDAEVRTGPPVDVAAVAFSCFRMQGKRCLAIGGVRGQRHPAQRLSAQELTQALQGWKAPVLMLRVMQELAQFWELHLIGLDPAWHMLNAWPYSLNARHRDTARRIADSHNALWTHFDAQRGPDGWMVLPPHSDDRLAATALSPEKRARQIQRADYWIRTANLLRAQLRNVLQRPDPRAELNRNTEAHTVQGMFSGYDDSRHGTPSSVLDSLPASNF